MPKTLPSKERWISIRLSDAKRAIEALDEVAHFNAGQSQAPDLFNAEDTVEYATARSIEHAIRQES